MRSVSTHRNRGIAYGLLASASWGGSIVLSKHSLNSIDSNSLFFAQISSAFVFAMFVGYLKGVRIGLKNFKGYTLGFFEPYLAYVLSLMGLSYIGAGEASIIFSIESVFIVLISAVFYKKITGDFVSLVILLIFSLIGVYLILQPSINNNAPSLIGFSLVLFGALSAAIYVVLSSKLMQHVNPLELIIGQLFFSFILSSFFIPYLTSFGIKDILLASLTGVIQYFLAFYFYLNALKYINVNLAGVMLYLIPFFAFIFSIIFLRESYGALQILGGLILLVSIFLFEKNHGHD